MAPFGLPGAPGLPTPDYFPTGAASFRLVVAGLEPAGVPPQLLNLGLPTAAPVPEIQGALQPFCAGFCSQPFGRVNTRKQQRSAIPTGAHN